MSINWPVDSEKLFFNLEQKTDNDIFQICLHHLGVLVSANKEYNLGAERL